MAATLPRTQRDRERDAARAALAAHLACFGVVGLVDAALSPWSDEPRAWGLLGGLALHWGLALLVLPLVALGAELLAPLPWWWRQQRVKPREVALALGLALCVGSGAGWWWGWQRGIEWSAVDPRPLVALGLGGLGGLGVFGAARRLGGPLGWLGALGVGAACVCVGALAAGERVGPSVERLALDGGTSKVLAVRARALLDDDQDGYPSGLCGALCDCDDTSASVSPVAVELPGNGVDEDCAGGDLALPPAPPLKLAAPSPAPAPPLAQDGLERPNLLLITVDTLRADHLSCYGYERPTSPHLDAWAKEAVLFQQARSHGPMTRFAVPPLMAGRYFSELDRTGGSWPRVLESNLLITELLREVGYHTAAFHSIGYLMPLFGFDQGFEVYDTSVIQERAPVHWNPTSDLMTDKLLAYLDGPLAQRPAGQPWFIWAYYGDPHAGYLSHKDMPSFGPEIWDLYDQEIAFTDHHLGRLFEGLRQRDEFHNTVIVLTADHGEGLDPSKPDNHGLQYHGQTLYDNLVKVPLIISGPTFKPRVVQTPVGHLDVFPTLASLASAPIPASEPPRQGVSLLPYLKGQDPEHPPLFAEKTTTEAVPQKSILRWPYKLIWKIGLNRYELYNLAQDPTEQRPLDEPETLKRLQDELLLWRASTLREIPARGEY